MDYKTELEKFLSLSSEIELIRSNISKRILAIVLALIDSEYRLKKTKHLCTDNHYLYSVPRERIKPDLRDLSWYIEKNVCCVSWEYYRAGDEYDTEYEEFDIEFIYDENKFQNKLSQLDQESLDFVQKTKQEKEDEEKAKAKAEWDLYQKLSKKYSDNAEKLDVSQ